MPSCFNSHHVFKSQSLKKIVLLLRLQLMGHIFWCFIFYRAYLKLQVSFRKKCSLCLTNVRGGNDFNERHCYYTDIYIVTNSQVLFQDGSLLHSKTQYTALDYSSQLFCNSNTSITDSRITANACNVL
jgi:hypothetical protein